MPVRSHSALAGSIGVASASLSPPLTGIKKRALLTVMRLTTLRGSCFYRGRQYFPSTLHRLITKDEWAKFSTHYHRILTQLTDGSSPHTGQWHARSRHSRPQKQKYTKDELHQKRGIRYQRHLRLHGTLFGVYSHNLDTLIVAKGAPRLLKAGSALPMGRIDEQLRLASPYASVMIWQSTRWEFTGPFTRPVVRPRFGEDPNKGDQYRVYSFGAKKRGDPTGLVTAFGPAWNPSYLQSPIHHLKGRLGSVRYRTPSHKTDMAFQNFLAPGEDHEEREKDAFWDGSLRFSLAMGRRICQVWSGDANATLAKIPYRPWVGGSSIASKSNDNGERFLRFLVAADLVATNTFQRTSASPKVLGTFFGNKHPTQIDF